jgi:hypothetical protein
LLREGCASANVCLPLISARVPFNLSTAEPPRCVSAGFSPIDAKGASKKYGRARAHVHTAYTTFPQAAKAALRTQAFSQLHAFAEEKSNALGGFRQENLKNLVACAVEKAPICKIYFLSQLFLLLTCNSWCVEFSVRQRTQIFFYFLSGLSSRSNS